MCTRTDWRNKKQDFESNGNLIKTKIREQIYRNEYYPSIDDIAAENWIPNNLQKLLRVWIQSEVNVQSIGQAIIKSSHQNCSDTYPFWVACGTRSCVWIKLQFVRCKCRTENRRCSTSICSCRKHGLKCVSSCGTCIRGKSCKNNDVKDLIFISHFYKGSKRSEHTISLYGSRTMAP